MNKKLFSVLMIISAIILMGCSKREEEKFDIHRGVNVSHWLSQTKIRGTEREHYVTAKDFQAIAKAGFDHVRLPIDEIQMWDENGKMHKDAFKLLHNAINWAFNNDLRVIVDLHVLRSHHFNNPDSRKLWTDRSAQENFIKFWHDLSSELHQYPTSKLAYEPLNEAVADNPEDWNKLINWVISEIRDFEPSRTIIMGSNKWQMVSTFKDLKVRENDPNIILSFHFYEPFLLTHYQTSWSDLKNITAKVNYPGYAVDTTQYSKLSADEIATIKRFNGVNNRETLEKQILQAVKVAKKYNLKLFCGEFGAFPSTPIELRKLWYSDMISIFDKYDIAWCHWNYKNDFPLFNQDLKPIEDIIKTLIPE